jgi:hypothetical protein
MAMITHTITLKFQIAPSSKRSTISNANAPTIAAQYVQEYRTSGGRAAPRQGRRAASARLRRDRGEVVGDPVHRVCAAPRNACTAGVGVAVRSPQGLRAATTRRLGMSGRTGRGWRSGRRVPERCSAWSRSRPS